jgi:PTS system fructose-specific IIC component
MITEGVIPIAAVDLLRVVASCTFGAAVGGGLSMMWNVGSPVPSGGMFIVPAMTHPLLFTLALFIGSTVTGVMLFLWKKEPVENQDYSMEEEEDEIDLSGIKIS